MKAFMSALVLLGWVHSVFATDQAELNARIGILIANFNAMQQRPAERVPADALRRAKGVILLDRMKAGFILAGQSGGGVAIVKDNSGNWSPVAFTRSAGGSFGFQAGGEQEFCVILLMDSAATHALADSKVVFGNEARGTAGGKSSGAEANFNSSPQSVMVYSQRSGLYGGFAFKGGTLYADGTANEIYYGKPVSLYDILFESQVAATSTSQSLAHAIEVYSGK